MGLIRIGEGNNRIPVRSALSPRATRASDRCLAVHQDDDLGPGRVWTTIRRDIPSLRSYLVDAMIPALT